jgi:hypothetical protein
VVEVGSTGWQKVNEENVAAAQDAKEQEGIAFAFAFAAGLK